MISRRDNLLIRPWQQRRYDDHRRKVKSATAAIDNKPPATRKHVTIKLKKKQKEEERCEEIKKNNFTLLKRLSYAMRTSRVDNYWTTPQPNFLNRVNMYNTIVPSLESLSLDEIDEVLETEKPLSGRKSKCAACTPQPIQQIPIPEERIPWEPEKQAKIHRIRSKSLTCKKITPISQKPVSKSANYYKPHSKSTTNVERKKIQLPNESSQRIILTRGCLKLSVNFPSDSQVKLQEGSQEKILVHGVCNCKHEIGVN